MSLSLSVIICTKDRPDDLRNCILSILNGERQPDELIIIDDGKFDPDWIETKLSDLDIKFHYRRKSPPNVNASRNLAVSIASSDILSFIDDDVILDPYYYSSVMKAFEEDHTQQVAGITGVIDIYTNPLKRAYLRLFGLESCRPGAVQRCGEVTLVRAGEIDRPTRVQWLSGCNMNFHRGVFEKYRFNEQDSGYIWGDDRDFTYPIGKEYTLLALPNARLVHKKSPVSRSSARNLGRMEIFHLGRFFITYLPHRIGDWFFLGWAFIGIFLKNLLNVFNYQKGLSGFNQLLGNFEGFAQFIGYVRRTNGKAAKG